ncbi:IQ and ubiquitin-like domain-containing protein isoform X2 [Rhinolophus ferrumequinum]|uniref:IQ and ubiquitin-like domain-containing protein isoform X2 n=1 Tax=Rhinolophus ferrumequinum TaxID=59479 RepID=UPI00140FED4A|nr:IQ and ubiquitin-like domain-containing protein isoform X2 [Rhinolophus ferrumequinum]
MSDQEEEFTAQNIPDAPGKRDGVYETITIPVPSEDLPESDQTEDNESEPEENEPEPEDSEPEPEPSGGGHEVRSEAQSDQSASNLEINEEEQLLEEIMLPEQALDSPVYSEKHSLTQLDNAIQSTKQQSDDYHLTFLDKIKAVKESLKTSMQQALATVKVVLLPVGQEIVMRFRIDTILKHLKDHFANQLSVPADVLQIRCAGTILKNNETLLQHGINAQDIVQVEIFSLLPDLYPIRGIHELNDASQVINVRVQTGIDQYEQVAVEIMKSNLHKPFLGGFRHKITGIEYHNAGTQTVPKKTLEKCNVFCRDTQTVFQRKKLQQTTNTTSTQMTKIGVYVSNMTDKLVTPGKYFSAAEYHAQRLAAVIVLQTYYRQWHAKIVVENIRRQKMLRLKWEEEEKLRKIREKEEWMKLDYYRRHNPKTKEDFELLYNALELWRQEELECINQTFTGAERKAALCELLEKETQLIASIGRHRHNAYMENQEALIQAFLDKVPQDPLKFYKKIHFCHCCQLYLPSTEFAVSSTAHHVYRCRNCVSLDNETRKRESFLKYKCMLQRLFYSEVDYEDDSKIAFLMQLEDIQYLTENIWSGQSVLSAWKDLGDLVLVRWEKSLQWSPWNCILLTKDEGAAHLKLTSIEEGYEPTFIHKIKHKHILAKNYFSQIPVLASFMFDDDEIEEIRKQCPTETTANSVECQRPSP